MEIGRLRATRGGAVEGVRAAERDAGEAAQRTAARPAARRPGHGRTLRPGLEERIEEHNLPADARRCSCCGKPYAAVGAEESALFEIEVRAHRRVIRRPALAPAVRVRLVADTSLGASRAAAVRQHGLRHERLVAGALRALRVPAPAAARWRLLGEQGLPVSPGTLADSVPRFVPLFEPLAGAILARQNAAALRHADETTWRVQALRGTAVRAAPGCGPRSATTR